MCGNTTRKYLPSGGLTDGTNKDTQGLLFGNVVVDTPQLGPIQIRPLKSCPSPGGGGAGAVTVPGVPVIAAGCCRCAGGELPLC